MQGGVSSSRFGNGSDERQLSEELLVSKASQLLPLFLALFYEGSTPPEYLEEKAKERVERERTFSLVVLYVSSLGVALIQSRGLLTLFLTYLGLLTLSVVATYQRQRINRNARVVLIIFLIAVIGFGWDIIGILWSLLR